MPMSSRSWSPPALCFTLAVGAVFVLACGGGGGGDPPGGPFGLSQRPLLSALGFPDAPPDPRPVDLVRALPSLSFSRPIYAASAPAPDGTHWLYVAEQDGRIYAMRNDDATATRTVLLDLRAAVGGPVSRDGNEEGLLGVAFDTDYGVAGADRAGQFYIHYSAASPRRSVLSRFRATFTNGAANAPEASAASEEIVLEVAQPYSNHNGGMLDFGPDDLLYMSLGDGGDGNDPLRHGQNLGTLLGSILRIDVRNPPSGAEYGIPEDNPFVDRAGARPEIYAYGARNPWRFSFDRQTGALWVGDVGQVQREEIDLVRRGDNMGWPLYEGSLAHLDPSFVPATPPVPPVYDYPRSQGTTVVGGIVYRGMDVPSLMGSYLFGDYGSGRIWALVHDGIQAVELVEIQNLGQIVHFGEDEDGEALLVSHAGTLHRLREPSGGTPPPPFPDLLSETLLFSNLATLQPVAGLLPYELNSPLWSDDAEKRRWMGIPGQSEIVFRPTQPWTFPRGTVFVKHFEIETTPGDSSSLRRLETRVLLHGSEGWAGYTYRWLPDGSDAVLLSERETETIDIDDPLAPGGVRQQTWTYPSRTDCMRCHTTAAGIVLGVRTGQVHRDFAFPEAVDDQLRTWNHIGLFTTNLGSTEAYERWPDPADEAVGTAERARSYLAANCAQCHLPGGPAPGTLDLRLHTAAAAMGAIDVRPSQGDLGLPDAWIVRSGDHAASVLWERLQRLDNHRMPPLGSSVVDELGSDVVGDWIDGLPQ